MVKVPFGRTIPESNAQVSPSSRQPLWVIVCSVGVGLSHRIAMWLETVTEYRTGDYRHHQEDSVHWGWLILLLLIWATTGTKDPAITQFIDNHCTMRVNDIDRPVSEGFCSVTS